MESPYDDQWDKDGRLVDNRDLANGHGPVSSVSGQRNKGVSTQFGRLFQSGKGSRRTVSEEFFTLDLVTFT